MTRSRLGQSSSTDGGDGAGRHAPAPGKRSRTESIKRKASAEATDGGTAAGALSEPCSDAAADTSSALDLMSFFMGPEPSAAPRGVQMKPGKDAAPSKGGDVLALVSDVDAALDMIFRQAEEALVALEQADDKTPDHAARDAIVDKYAAMIHESAVIASRLVQQRSADQRPIFFVRADLAAERVLAVQTWIMERTGNARMRSRFEPAVRAVDGVLRSLARDPVAARSTPALRARERFESIDEKADLELALRDHAIALRAVRDAKIIEGIEPFRDLAGLEDNPQPSFLIEMMKSILVATIGHLAGGVFGLAMKGAGKVNAHLKNVTIDSVQGIGAHALDEAAKEAAKDPHAKTKALTFFVAGLKSAARKEQDAHEGLIGREARDGVATAASIRQETAALRAMESNIGKLYLQRASAGWASYIAQQALGRTGSGDRSGRQASNMKHFFGEPLRDDSPNGDRAFGSHKSQLDGVLHLHLEIDTDPRHGAKADIRRKGRVTVEGVNETLRDQILLEADGHIGKVWLPKVVYVSMARNSFHAARLALDERNTLRDHTEWDYIQRHTQHVADRTFESPQAFVGHLLRTELS